MKIGYITKQDPLDKKAYSGTHYYMYRALQAHFGEVIPLGPVDTRYKVIPKLKGRFLRTFTRLNYKYQYDTGLNKRMAGILDQKIQDAHPEALICSLMSPEVAYLKSDTPLFLTTDATFPLLHELYQSHSNLHPTSIREALELESQAFEKATKLILPLEWLADSAMKDYGVPSSKIEVISYGPNLDTSISESELDEVVANRQGSPKVKLLFVGVRWEEKGGPFAVEVLRVLLENGIDAELLIAGCDPVISDKPEEVRILGFIDKETGEGREQLHQLYREATFFIMPTHAECVGMSFIEAASYGLPAIGTYTGGVPEAVLHGQTGYLCEEGESPKEVAQWIGDTFKNPEAYKSFCRRAHSRYSAQMNWNDWAKRVRQVIENSMK